jgi:CRP-like cAMP-binding protein
VFGRIGTPRQPIRKEAALNPDPADLRKIPLFDSLSDEDLDRISKWLEVRAVETGRRLISEGASGYSFFVMLDGTAEAVQNGQVIGTLGPGDFFGERAMLESGRRMADVVATTPMTVAAMFGTDFRQMQDQYPEMAEHIQAVAERR